jgi:hypothetical protein
VSRPRAPGAPGARRPGRDLAHAALPGGGAGAGREPGPSGSAPARAGRPPRAARLICAPPALPRAAPPPSCSDDPREQDAWCQRLLLDAEKSGSLAVGIATMPYALPHAAVAPPAAVAICFPDRFDGQFSPTVRG